MTILIQELVDTQRARVALDNAMVQCTRIPSTQRSLHTMGLTQACRPGGDDSSAAAIDRALNHQIQDLEAFGNPLIDFLVSLVRQHLDFRHLLGR